MCVIRCLGSPLRLANGCFAFVLRASCFQRSVFALNVSVLLLGSCSCTESAQRPRRFYPQQCRQCCSRAANVTDQCVLLPVARPARHFGCWRCCSSARETVLVGPNDSVQSVRALHFVHKLQHGTQHSAAISAYVMHDALAGF